MNESYRVLVCTCPDGPRIGARGAGTPDTCHWCGRVTAEQWAAIRQQVAEEAE